MRAGHPPDPLRAFWMAAIAAHRMLAPAASGSAEPERINSKLTALVTGSRNRLTPSRLVQLGLLRMLTQGTWARVPRWRKLKPPMPMAGGGGGGGAGAGAGAGAGGPSLASSFAQPPALRDDDALEAVDLCEVDDVDLLSAVEDAVCYGGNDEDLDTALGVAHDEAVDAAAAVAANLGIRTFRAAAPGPRSGVGVRPWALLGPRSGAKIAPLGTGPERS